ncbi:AAA-ATPase ASD, mitochondrial-like [Rhododendron vialii]|uniref:AAA-ATPase ASD, mitochondrial-like n=1 Tax=Rhododendron vialii TaxID=182163 RepID=UPI00265DD4B6|nr:AAA-ATPase ASD, mitochondrial-like [Rhododendron vialii]
MKMMGESWAELGSRIAGLMFVWATIQQFFPHQLRAYLDKVSDKLLGIVYPFVQITVHEYTGGRRNEVYAAIESYLGAKSTAQARRLKADMVKNSKSFVLSLDKSEEVTDEFRGVKLWWVLKESVRSPTTFSLYRSAPDERKYYMLSFHRKNRDIVAGAYLSYVMEEGKALELKNRQRKLYTNKPNDSWGWEGKHLWNHIVFEHPASFRTLAMDPKKKQEIIDDLIAFGKSKEYYAKIGKAWKRGYLLYGPPGTGKSTMIAAMANFLNYDVYDLELTSVKNNSDLRKLLVDTSSKSIIVIEDIDCSLDLTGKRMKKKKGKSGEEEQNDPLEAKEKENEGDDGSKVTLSGLLNFIDGIWSACGPERIIIFTTNHKDKLDPALIRRGRMDIHIEMSYCKFEAFKVLAKNYLDVDSHPLFETVGRLLEETSMSPCDVAENLIPKTASKEVETCLNNLVEALNKAKQTARLNAEKEAKTKKVSARRYSRWMKMIGKLRRKNED